MNKLYSFYLSRILDKKIYDKNNIEIGRLDDILVANDDTHLSLVGFKVKGRHYKKLYIKYENAQFFCEKGKERVVIDKVVRLGDHRDYVGLKFNLLDKQVVDLSGKKVVRINDVKISEVNGIYRIIAVDIGFTGLLRRLGIEGQTKKLFKRLNDQLIIWENIETLQKGNPNVKLVMPYKKLSKLHPADLADIIEELDTRDRRAVMESLSPELASDTLEEMDQDVQINILENIDIDTAVDLLSDMPADEAADIIEELYEEHAESILNSMDKEDAEEIREIMEYDENSVGSLMTTEYMSFSKDTTVGEVIEALRKAAPPEDMVYYLYVVDNDGHLLGVVTLRQIIIAEPDTRLESIMHTNVVFVKDTDSIDDLIELVNKYYLLALPVVDDESRLTGMAIISDIVDEVLLPRWKRRPA